MRYVYCGQELIHHGTKGQKWGERNYQNPDGSYTAQGQAENNGHGRYAQYAGNNKRIKNNKSNNKKQNNKERIDPEKKKIIKKILIGTAVTAGVVGAGYLAYRYIATNKINSLYVKDPVKDLDIFLESREKELDRILKDSIDDFSYVLNDKDIIHRMEGFKDIDITKFDTKQYVAFDKMDVDAYKALLRDWHYTGERFDNEYSITKTINIPSLNKAKEIFNEYISKNPQYLDQLRDSIESRWGSGSYDTHFGKRKNDLFKTGIYSFVLNNDDSKGLMDFYKSKGYDALIDYFDKGTLANKPLILFDPKNHLKKIGETFVSKLDKEAAIDNLVKSNHISIKDFRKDAEFFYGKSVTNSRLATYIKDLI